MDYYEFLDAKTHIGYQEGFDPIWMPSTLFDFQVALCDWAVRKGRGAIFADTGLGKTAMQLTWAENVVRKTNKSVLLLTPIAVAGQTLREALKFGIEAVRSKTGEMPTTAKIVVANYERLHYFNSADFAGVVCDESSCIKNSDSKTRSAVTNFMKKVQYRLLCTATAAPNDYIELGTSSEALGDLGFQDMISKFFKQETSKDHLGWGRTKYRMRGHAERDFWRWICSWARAVRKPSDLGFSDSRFALPPLEVEQTLVTREKPKKGFLFAKPAVTLEDQREERRATIAERCQAVADLCGPYDRSVIWCHLNDEGDLLEKSVPESKQVSGDHSDDEKEEIFESFTNGHLRRIIIKPKIGAWGLNWQHCRHQTFFPSHSFEQYYQGVRRCWRFGQTRSVRVDIVTSEGEEMVMKNLQRKAEAAEKMFSSLVSEMNNSLKLDHSRSFSQKEVLPSWA